MGAGTEDQGGWDGQSEVQCVLLLPGAGPVPPVMPPVPMQDERLYT